MFVVYNIIIFTFLWSNLKCTTNLICDSLERLHNYINTAKEGLMFTIMTVTS